MIQTRWNGKTNSGWRRPIGILLVFHLLTVGEVAFCQTESAKAGGNSAGQQPVDSTPAATVGGFTITRNQVLREFREANTGDQEPSPQVMAHALRHLVRKQVVLAELQKGPAAMGPSELTMEIGKIEARLAETGTSLEKHAANAGASIAEFRNELQWRTVWQRHLDEKINETAIATYFELNHSRFDGTLVNVDQVLWVFTPEDTPDQRAKMRELASRVYQRLKSGEINWSSAIGEYSMSPLAKKPGDRWIGWRGPMPRTFTDAAFDLMPGEFSLPVESAIGLHIIRCIEIRAGDRKPGEVITEVREAMAEGIFDNIANQALPSHDVRYSGQVPYLNANDKLIEPVVNDRNPDRL